MVQAGKKSITQGFADKVEYKRLFTEFGVELGRPVRTGKAARE